MSKTVATTSRTLWIWITAGLSVVAILAPWLRNREYIRDFFDYGLMMIAAGRINSGELPYVDFSTPLQSGSYWINAAAEWVLGPTFQSLVWANGIFIVLGWWVISLLLRRAVSAVPAMILAAVLIAGSACQHTIIWYNAIGVVALACVAIGVAVAPTLSKANLSIHTLVALALVLGGMNKINFQVIALAAAWAWTLRAGLNGKAPWTIVGKTLGIWTLAGLIAPVVLEMWLTGASWQQWKTNVIIMPFSVRGDYLSDLGTVGFYLRPMHDYYGPVIKPVGLIIVLWTLTSAALAWPKRTLPDRLSIIGATLFTIVATGGLMATNHEIIYISMAAGIAMIISMWVGLGLINRPKMLVGALLLPALIFGAIMLISGWHGQRSQFGHSVAMRSEYVDLGKADETFAYLRGTKIPPQLAESLKGLKLTVPPANDQGVRSCFYATGAEYLERFWPNHKLPEMPLLLAPLTLGPSQLSDLRNALGYPPSYKMLIGMEAWTGSWPGDLLQLVNRNSTRQDIGLFQAHSFSGEWLKSGLPPTNNAIEALGSFKGNVYPGVVTVIEPLWPLSTPSSQPLLGTYEQRGSFTINSPSYRVSGEVALQRGHRSEPIPLRATFSVHNSTIPEGSLGSLIWAETFELEADKAFETFEYKIDTRGMPTRYVVSIEPESVGQLRAGYFMPRIAHSDPTPGPPPVLRKPALSEVYETAALKRALLPIGWVNDVEIVARGVELNDDGAIIIAHGGELWLKPTRPMKEFHGRIGLVAPSDQSGAPVARVIWYRGGRMEVFLQAGLNPPDRSIQFKCWPPEEDGWFGILIDPSHNPHGLSIEIESIEGR